MFVGRGEHRPLRIVVYVVDRIRVLQSGEENNGRDTLRAFDLRAFRGFGGKVVSQRQEKADGNRVTDGGTADNRTRE